MPTNLKARHGELILGRPEGVAVILAVPDLRVQHPIGRADATSGDFPGHGGHAQRRLARGRRNSEAPATNAWSSRGGQHPHGVVRSSCSSGDVD